MGGGEIKGVVAEKVEPTGLGNVFMTGDCSQNPGDCMSVGPEPDVVFDRYVHRPEDLAEALKMLTLREASRPYIGNGFFAGCSHYPYIGVGTTRGAVAYNIEKGIETFTVAPKGLLETLCATSGCGVSNCYDHEVAENEQTTLLAMILQARKGAVAQSLVKYVQQKELERLAIPQPDPADSSATADYNAQVAAILEEEKAALRPVKDELKDVGIEKLIKDWTGFEFVAFASDCPDKDGKPQVRLIIGRKPGPPSRTP